MAVGGVAVFPADTVYGLACDPGSDGRGRAPLRAEAPGARQARRGHVLRRRPRARRAARARPPHPRRARRAAPRRRDAPAAEPGAPLPARVRAGPGDARPARARPAAGRGGARRRALAGPAVQREPRGRPGRPAAGGRPRADPRRARTCCSTRASCRGRRRRSSTCARTRTTGAWRIVRQGAVDADEVAAACAEPIASRAMSDLPSDFFNRPLADVDPEVADAVRLELERQQRTLEMIASENFVPQAVLEAQGSVLTNKYAEGYPGKRYYGGCEHVDVIEQLAIDRAKELFGAEHANVQPHAGAQANAAAFHALMQPGDTLMGLALPHGGHLSHGMKINFSGRLYDIAAYEVDRETSLIDMDAVARMAEERRPKVHPRRAGRRTRGSSTSRASARSPTASARCSSSTWPTSPGLVAAGPAPEPGARTPTSSRRPSTRRSAARAAGSSSAARSTRRRSTPPCSPASRAGRSSTSSRAKAVALRIAASEAFRERQERTIVGRAGGRRRAAPRGPRRERPDRRHRRAPRARRPARERDRRPAGRGPPARDRHHRQPQRGPVRPAPADGHERPARRRAARWRPAACRRRTSPRSARSWRRR